MKLHQLLEDESPISAALIVDDEGFVSEEGPGSPNWQHTVSIVPHAELVTWAEAQRRFQESHDGRAFMEFVHFAGQHRPRRGGRVYYFEDEYTAVLVPR